MNRDQQLIQILDDYAAAYCRHAAGESDAMPDKLDYVRRIDALYAQDLEQMVRDDAGPDPTDR